MFEVCSLVKTPSLSVQWTLLIQILGRFDLPKAIYSHVYFCFVKHSALLCIENNGKSDFFSVLIFIENKCVQVFHCLNVTLIPECPIMQK